MKLLNTAKLENLPQSLENIVFQIVDDMPQAKTELIETVTIRLHIHFQLTCIS